MDEQDEQNRLALIVISTFITEKLIGLEEKEGDNVTKEKREIIPDFEDRNIKKNITELGDIDINEYLQLFYQCINKTQNNNNFDEICVPDGTAYSVPKAIAPQMKREIDIKFATTKEKFRQNMRNFLHNPSSPIAGIQTEKKYNFDFTNVSPVIDNKYLRGGLVYLPPYGWQRYAVKLKDKYRDDKWMEATGGPPDQYRSAPGDWAVSYSGMKKNKDEGFINEKCYKIYHKLTSICKLSPIEREKVISLAGLCSTPDIEIASQFSHTIEFKGESYKVVFQNRVNPNNMTILCDGDEKQYWVSKSQDDICISGYCLKKV